MIHLYTSSTPNGHKVSCLLEALEMPYEAHAINLAEGEQFKSDFLKISPNGRIPAIVDTDNDVIIDGHLSHFLDVDAIIVLRCDPVKLRARLESRGYSEAKINANVEWELIAGTWSEIAEFEIDVPILELDSSALTFEEMVEKVLAWVNIDFKDNSTTISKAIDWLT